MTVVGGLNVTPKQLSYANMNISGVSKVYDGSVAMNNLTINTPAGVLVGDQIIATATGTFASKNVGTSLSYNLGVVLGGIDRANYQVVANSLVNNGLYAGANGVITQLNSVTYTGPNSGGNWSNPANWTTTGTAVTGAVPDLSNVANVIIPVGLSVVYDNAVVGPVTSAVSNNGNLNINLAANTTMSMPIVGGGSVALSGTGVVTMSGTNSYSGGTILNPGSSLVVANASAIGTPNVTSNATALNPASFKVSSGVTLPFLNITGGTVQLMSDITTTGTQSYANLILAATGSGTTTMASNNANIVFNGLIDSANAKTQSLTVSAGTGSVMLGDSIGSVARLSRVIMTGRVIDILADILTADTQTYNGSVFIGDASYVGKTPTVGFLFNSRSNYFEYSTAGVTSTISYLNRNPIFVRTLISEDPSVTFNGSVNDLVTSTHTLLVGAIATDNSTAASNAASVTFAAPVGALSPLYSLNAQTVVSAARPDLAASYVGSIAVTGGVETFASQTYRASVMTAQAATQPGNVVFSVYDPTATVSYYLPLQSNGQMNLQNPNSTDTLTINGVNNYAAVSNSTGTNNWGTRLIQGNAFNFVPPVYVAAPAPAVFVPPAPARVSIPPVFAPPFVPRPNLNLNISAFSAGALQQALQTYVNSPAPEMFRAEAPQTVSTLVGNVTVEQAAVAEPGRADDAVSPSRSGAVRVEQADNRLGAGVERAQMGGERVIEIRHQVILSDGPATLSSVATPSGFALTLPDGLMLVPTALREANLVVQNGVKPRALSLSQVLNAIAEGVLSDGNRVSSSATTVEALRVVLADGSPLPAWLVFDPVTKTLTARDVPEGTEPLKVKLQVLNGGAVLGESEIAIDIK